MRKFLLTFTLAAVAAFGQYKSEPAGAPPSEVAPAMAALLNAEGTKVMRGANPVLSVWFVKSLPTGPKSSEAALTLPEVPHGAFLGIVKVEARTSDRRANPLKPGVYTMRFSYYPVNGAHQGIAPQRDFVILTGATTDTDAKSTPDFTALYQASEKTAGIPHPLVLSIWKADMDFKSGFAKSAEHDEWILQTKIGDTPVAIILQGVAEG